MALLAKGRQADRQTAFADGEVDGATKTMLREFNEKFDRLFKLVERIDTQFRAHEIDCVKFRAETVAAQTQTGRTLEKLGRDVGNINARFAHVAVRLADQSVANKILGDDAA